MLGVATIALRAAGCTSLKPSLQPISHWEFDETSAGNGVFEDRGPAHVLMILEGTWADPTTGSLVEGVGGTSAYTDGSGYATLPANTPAHDLAELTISFYYQRASAAAKQVLLAAGEATAHEAGDFSIEVLANGRLRAWHVGQDGVLRFFESTDGITGTNLQVGTAHRIDLSLGPQGARIYLDGSELAAAIPENTNGWNNGRVKYLGRWTDGVQAPAVGVFDRLRIWDRQLSSAEIVDLKPAQSVTLPQPEPGQGISIPAFENQTITDSVPADAVWWDPTNGNDGSDGSTGALAKKTFGAAQNAIGAGGTVVVAGGHHVVPELVFTKSGTSANRLKLFAEPGAEVVLYREGDFVGAVDRTWTWTLVDSTRQIWESPDLGISDGETVVNASGSNGSVSGGSALWGFIRCPNGAHGRPHLMRMYWYDTDGNMASNAFNADPNRTSGEFITDGGYGGPGLYVPGNGKVRIRMQPAGNNYQSPDWPKDGRMGDLVNTSTGYWQEPITQDPNDYEIHMVRFNPGEDSGGDYGTAGPTLIDLNGHSWWHVKGINGALMNIAIDLDDGAENNWFEKCTFYPIGIGVRFQGGSSRNNTFTRCMFLTGDNRSIAWGEHKGSSKYWTQHGRHAGVYGSGGGANTGAGTLFEHCIFFGWFDFMIGMDDMDGVITVDHCAVLNTIDDGLMQNSTNKDWGFIVSYTYFAGGPAVLRQRQRWGRIARLLHAP